MLRFIQQEEELTDIEERIPAVRRDIGFEFDADEVDMQTL